MQVSPTPARSPFKSLSLSDAIQKPCGKTDSISAIKISTAKPKPTLYTLVKQSSGIISRSEPIVEPMNLYTKSVTAVGPEGKKLDRGDEEYIKVLKQAILEVMNENELLRKRVGELDTQVEVAKKEKGEKDSAIVELMMLIQAGQSEQKIEGPMDIEQGKEGETKRRTKGRKTRSKKS